MQATYSIGYTIPNEKRNLIAREHEEIFRDKKVRRKFSTLKL